MFAATHSYLIHVICRNGRNGTLLSAPSAIHHEQHPTGINHAQHVMMLPRMSITRLNDQDQRWKSRVSQSLWANGVWAHLEFTFMTSKSIVPSCFFHPWTERKVCRREKKGWGRAGALKAESVSRCVCVWLCIHPLVLLYLPKPLFFPLLPLQSPADLKHTHRSFGCSVGVLFLKPSSSLTISSFLSLHSSTEASVASSSVVFSDIPRNS